MLHLTTLIAVIATLELLLAAALLKRYIRTKRPLTLCVLLICLGLFIDAFLIAIGAPAGGLSENVSKLRFIAHGALIPLLLPICGYGLKAKPLTMKVLWGFTAVVMALGLAHAFAINLDVTEYSGVLRHTMADSSPAWARIVSSALSFGTVLPLIICGIIVWIRQKTPYLFLSGLLMFVFAGLGPAIGRFDLIFFISMFGELFMIAFAFLYIIHDEKINP